MNDKRRPLTPEELAWKSKLNNLNNSPISKVDDFQKPLVKDLPVDKIKPEFAPVRSGQDFATDQIVRDQTSQVRRQLDGKDVSEKIYDAAAMKKEYLQKMKLDKLAQMAGRVGKKAMGVIPLAGAAYAGLSGDPAMAAEELAGDVPVLGQVYEAIKPTDSGNVEEERQMIAERNAQVNYNNSPAHLARLAAIQKLGK